ncbi:HNH endonuclease [Candidatus Albibeggiatoa sp. nov. NOAA]|uniref:HNH endonuclease n=1 Tax=Candidatus Albibeggiatoa sp. nov. NOAA TaxID=3162724 RepID=UPI0032FD6260|nr:HNH endonuclease [Thiotrichaceae bacterium]
MDTDILSRSIVVFSKSYLPIGRVNIKRAIILLITEKAEPLEIESASQPIHIRSPNTTLAVPQHIRLTVAHKERRWRVPAVSRREILRRDKHACQYCGSTKKLTIDHVMPRSRGGTHTWDNVVTACERCNSRKGDRTPQEAGMLMRTKPKAPPHPAVSFADDFWRSHHKKQVEEQLVGEEVAES